MTKYGIQHRTSKRWLTMPPSTGHHETPDEAKAYPFDFMSVAEAERIVHIPDFADAYSVELLNRG